jgi:hypothetical protein
MTDWMDSLGGTLEGRIAGLGDLNGRTDSGLEGRFGRQMDRQRGGIGSGCA